LCGPQRRDKPAKQRAQEGEKRRKVWRVGVHALTVVLIRIVFLLRSGSVRPRPPPRRVASAAAAPPPPPQPQPSSSSVPHPFARPHWTRKHTHSQFFPTPTRWRCSTSAPAVCPFRFAVSRVALRCPRLFFVSPSHPPFIRFRCNRASERLNHLPSVRFGAHRPLFLPARGVALRCPLLLTAALPSIRRCPIRRSPFVLLARHAS
jgi:hypothetical protein